MKILFLPAHYVFDEYLFGSEPYASFNIVDRVLKNNNEGSVVVTGKKFLKNNKTYKIIEVQKKKLDFDMSFFNAIIFSIKYTIAGIKLLRKEEFDIIHHLRPFLLGSTFNLIVLLGLNKDKPFIIGSFTSGYKQKDNNLISKIIKPLIFFLSVATLKKADKVIVYNEHTKNQVARYINPSRIEIIPPGKDKNDFIYDKDKKFSDPVKFLYVGNLIHRKGVDLLIKAFSLAYKNNPNIILKIVGDGEERRNLEMLTNKLGLASKIYFLGSIENKDIPLAYKDSHIFVSMQREESFGQIFIEAMACGLPIIATETIGARTIINKNNFGIIVSQENVNMFAEKMLLLIKNKTLAKEMSSEAREIFENNYDWEDVIIPKYLNVYNSVMNK